MPGKETRTAERRLANLIANKLQRPYSQMALYVKALMSMAVIRCNIIMLRNSRDRRHNTRPYLYDGASMNAIKTRHEM